MSDRFLTPHAAQNAGLLHRYRDQGNGVFALDEGEFQMRLDYDGRADDKPVYLGRAGQGVGSDAEAWTIQKFTYDGDARVVHIQLVRDVPWDDRAASF